MQKLRNRWLRAGVLLLFFIFCLVVTVLPPVIRRAIKQDRAGATARDGVATVAILVPGVSNPGSAPAPPQVSVRFQGGIRPVKEIDDIEGLKIDQPVKIHYRVGKSGHIYVDSLQPLSTPGLP